MIFTAGTGIGMKIKKERTKRKKTVVLIDTILASLQNRLS
jgi:hypothetical protein